MFEHSNIKMRQLNFFTIGIVLIAIIFSSCDDNIKRSGLPRSIGNTSEVLIVLQNESQWDNIIGKTIKKYLAQPQYGLLQNEPLFDLAHITVNNFSDMFEKHRNILIVNIDKKATSTKVEKFKNRWSDPQRIIRITSPSPSAFEDNFEKYAAGIVNDYSEAERSRILSVFRPSSKNAVLKEVRNTFNLNITVPQGFYIAKTKPGFMWIRKEVTDFSQGIIIISEPYKSEEQFTAKSIIVRTNNALQQYVPGETEGTHMAIDQEYVPAITTQISNFITKYAIEMRGVWDVKHDFMGGPFISYTFVDTKSNNILTIYGYVYHPNKKKRNLLRQVEAIIYSVKFMK